MLSVAPERPVDPLAIEILKQVDRVAQELGLEYFGTGATARDILLSGVFGLDTGRDRLAPGPIDCHERGRVP